MTWLISVSIEAIATTPPGGREKEPLNVRAHASGCLAWGHLEGVAQALTVGLEFTNLIVCGNISR